MVCEQGLVQLGLAHKRAAFRTGLMFVGSFVPISVGICTVFPSEVYVIGKPVCPV